MTTHNPIDDLFSKGLGTYSEQPSEAVWTGVEKKLRARRMWFRGFYLTGALLVLIGLVTLSIWLYQEPATPIAMNTTTLKPTPGQKDVLNETALNPDNNHVVTHTTEPSSFLNTEKKKEESPKLNGENVTENNGNKGTQATSPKASAEKNKPAITAQNPIVQQLTPVNEKINAKSSAEAAPVADPHKTVEPLTESVTEEITPAPLSSQKKPDENSAVAPEINNEVAPVTPPVAEEMTTEAPHDSVATAALKDNSGVIPPPPPATNYSPYKPRFEVLFYALPSYVFRSYTGLTDTENKFRRENEINPLFVNYGMEFRCTLKNFTIQTGVIQRQAGEKYAYDYSFIQHIDTTAGHYNVVITSHPDTANPGNTIITFDSSWVSVSDTTTAAMKLNHLNVYKYMEIPFNLGYVLNLEQHQIGVSGGVSLGLLSYASSGLLNSSANEIMPIATGSPMLKKVIYAYNVSLYYGFHVNAQTTLFMQAAYNQNLSGILKNTGFDVKYRSADAKIGVMFKL